MGRHCIFYISRAQKFISSFLKLGVLFVSNSGIAHGRRQLVRFEIRRWSISHARRLAWREFDRFFRSSIARRHRVHFFDLEFLEFLDQWFELSELFCEMYTRAFDIVGCHVSNSVQRLMFSGIHGMNQFTRCAVDSPFWVQRWFDEYFCFDFKLSRLRRFSRVFFISKHLHWVSTHFELSSFVTKMLKIFWDLCTFEARRIFSEII